MAKDSFIIIEKATLEETQDRLENWIEVYSKGFARDLLFETYSGDDNSTIIKTDVNLEDQHFIYLVDFLTFPQNTTSRGQVYGFTTIVDSQVFPNDQLNRRVKIFTADEDDEAGSICVLTKAGVLRKYSYKEFKNNLVKDKEFTFEEPEIDFSKLPTPKISATEKARYNFPTRVRRYYPLSELKEKKLQETKRQKEGQKIQQERRKMNRQRKKRRKEKKMQQLSNPYFAAKYFNIHFKFISFAVALALLINYILAFESSNYEITVYSLSMLVWIWLALEHDNLAIIKNYLKAFILAFSLAVFGWYLKTVDVHSDIILILLGTSIPLLFMLLQLLLRFVFVQLFKRAPIFTRSFHNWPDFLYSHTLFWGTIITPFYILFQSQV